MAFTKDIRYTPVKPVEIWENLLGRGESILVKYFLFYLQTLAEAEVSIVLVPVHVSKPLFSSGFEE